jgi:hypothetical protein
MRRLALLLGAGVLLSACSGGDSSGERRAEKQGTAAVENAVFAVRPRGAGSELVRLERRTLRTLQGRVSLGTYDGPWTRAPDGSAAAFGRARSSSVRIVGLRPLRLLGDVRVAGQVSALAWLAPRRVLAVLQTDWRAPVLRAVAIDPVARRVVASTALGRGWIVSGARRGDGTLVLLLSRLTSIEATRLVVLDRQGRARSTRLHGIRAGLRRVGDLDGQSVTESRSAGLAVGRDGRAFVLAAPPPLAAEIDLDTLSVRYHRLTEERGRLARLRDWIDPPAHAGGGGYGIGAHRRAAWLGDGLVAVTGFDERLDRSARPPRQVFEPAGLRIVDTRRWTIRTAEPKTTVLTRSGDAVVAWGGGGPALVVFGRDGKERLRLVRLPSRGWDTQFAWPYAYRGLSGVARRHRVDVIDLRTGELAARAYARGLVTVLGDEETLCWC